MKHIVRGSFFTILLIFLGIHLFSQDSLIFKWNVSSKKIADTKYALIFSTPGARGWQLYSSSQNVPDLNTAEIKFEDSAIIQENTLSEKGISKEVSSPVFNNAKVKVYEGETEWRKAITLKGVVPAQLQGD